MAKINFIKPDDVSNKDMMRTHSWFDTSENVEKYTIQIKKDSKWFHLVKVADDQTLSRYELYFFNDESDAKSYIKKLKENA